MSRVGAADGVPGSVPDGPVDGAIDRAAGRAAGRAIDGGIDGAVDGTLSSAPIAIVAPVLWYLKRAIPWPAPLGCLLTAASVLLAMVQWSNLTAIALPAIALLAGAAAGFAFDDTPVRVTTVSPRGTRWAPLSRLLVALTLGLVGSGLCGLAADHAGSDRSDWSLLGLAIAGSAVLVALLAGRRQVPRPGSVVASAVVLIGLTPLVLALLLDLRSPFPLEPWSQTMRTVCLALATLAWCGAGVLALDGRPRRWAQP